MPTYTVSDGLGNGVSLTDSIELFYTGVPVYTDTITLSDELDVLVISQAKKVWAILVGDNLSFNDDLGRFATYSTLLGDSYSITDRTAALNEKFLALVDSVSLLDAIGNIDSFYDGLSLLDVANYNLADVPITDYTFLLADSVLIGDDGSTFISAPEFLSVADILLLTDRAAVRVQANLTDYLRRYLNDVPTPLT